MKTVVNKEIIAGAFFIVSVVLIVMAIFSLGAKTGIGESKFYQYVAFNDVGGLRVGAPVRISGVTVGSVADIEFIKASTETRQRVKVTLSILSKYKKELSKNSLYTVKTEGILGEKLIDIQENSTGKQAELTKEGFVVGQDALDLYNLADDFSETTEYFNFLTSKMGNLVDDLQLFTRVSSRVVERFEDKLIEGGLFSLFTSPKRER